MFHTSIIALAQLVNHTLIARKQLIVTAESCSGGLIAGALTDVPGSSAAVFGGYVTYANEAEGALKTSGAAVAIAVTGIAGPGGGTEGKPVGLVHFAYADAGKTIHLEKRFGDLGRQVVREETVKTALGMVLHGLGVPRP